MLVNYDFVQSIDIIAQKVYYRTHMTLNFVQNEDLFMKIKFNLFALKRRLELHNGKAYTWESMAKGIGIHRNTMLNIANNKTERLDLGTVASMLKYFDSEGMPIKINDLFMSEE